MRITVPVSRHDTHLLPNWIEVNKHLKCGYQHQLHFVIPSAIREFADKAKEDLAPFFDTVTIHALDQEPSGGWPLGPNAQFHACAKIMAGEPNSPWFLCELDCLPIRPNAYDALAARYVSAGVPFFGFISPTPHRDPTGKIVSSPEGPTDTMLSGVAVYPGNMILRNSIGPLMDDFVKGPYSAQAPWDIHLRYAIRKDGMGHTDLLGNCWNTVKYRVEDGLIICDHNDQHEVYSEAPGKEKRRGINKVHPEAVVVHGCKDDSLAALVLHDLIPEVTFARPQKQAVTLASVENPKLTELEEQNKKLAAQLEQMMAMMQKLSQPSPPAAIQQGQTPEIPAELKPQTTVASWGEVQPEIQEEVKLGRVPTEDEVIGFLNSIKKNALPQTVARNFGCDLLELLGKLPTYSRLNVRENNPRWISIAQPSS